MLEKYNDFLNVQELCYILRVCKNTVYKLLKQQDIPNTRCGKKYIIPKQGVIEYITNIIHKNVDYSEQKCYNNNCNKSNDNLKYNQYFNLN